MSMGELRRCLCLHSQHAESSSASCISSTYLAAIHIQNVFHDNYFCSDNDHNHHFHHKNHLLEFFLIHLIGSIDHYIDKFVHGSVGREVEFWGIFLVTLGHSLLHVDCVFVDILLPKAALHSLGDSPVIKLVPITLLALMCQGIRSQKENC